VRGAIPIDLQVDKQSPIPIRRQLTEQLKHVIEAGGVPSDQPLPSIRELAGFLGINPNTVARVVEDLKRSAYVEVRRGKGVFVAAAPPARPSPSRRQKFLQDVVIRAAALGMTVDDVSVGVLSLTGRRPVAVQGTVGVLLVECSPPELDFFAQVLEAHLPVRIDKVLLTDVASAVRRQKSARRWGAAVTSFCHLPAVERRLRGMGIPVIAPRRNASRDAHRLRSSPGRGWASSPPRSRPPTTSALDARRPAEHRSRRGPSHHGPALGRPLRRVDVIVCSSGAADRTGTRGPRHASDHR
jgi:GntR family transcriptional regulator